MPVRTRAAPHEPKRSFLAPLPSTSIVLTPHMRPDSCGECGDDFVWDADAGSAVCPSCGVLQDSSQVVLDAHIEPEDNTRDRYALPFFSRSTLKGYRNSQGWYLPGQGKAVAAERNKVGASFRSCLSQDLMFFRISRLLCVSMFPLSRVESVILPCSLALSSYSSRLWNVGATDMEGRHGSWQELH